MFCTCQYVCIRTYACMYVNMHVHCFKELKHALVKTFTYMYMSTWWAFGTWIMKYNYDWKITTQQDDIFTFTALISTLLPPDIGSPWVWTCPLTSFGQRIEISPKTGSNSPLIRECARAISAIIIFWKITFRNYHKRRCHFNIYGGSSDKKHLKKPKILKKP